MRTLMPFVTARNFSGDLWKEMDRMFESSDMARFSQEFTPATEIVETEKQYMVSLDLPGLRKEDIKIEVDDNTLVVSGERKREVKTENEKVQKIEKSYGFFKRSFSLSSAVNTEKIEARYEHGVLELVLPKAQEAQIRKIEIQ